MKIREQDKRTAALIGGDAMNKIRGARVAVFGLGGVGGYATEMLARAGVGELMIIDSDTVSESNINRQIIATHGSVGMAKAELFKSRIMSINPECTVDARCQFATPESLADFNLKSYDYVIDAIDTVSTKLALAELCYNEKIPLISSMGTGNKLDATAFVIDDIYKTSVCPLARAMRIELKKRGVGALTVLYSKEPPKKPSTPLEGGKPAVASICFVPSTAGILIASYVIKKLAGL